MKYTSLKKYLHRRSLSSACNFIADPSGVSRESIAARNLGGFSSLPEVARSRDRSSLLVTILPFTPVPDYSLGILGLPVDCRPGATFGGHNAFTTPSRGVGKPPHPRGRRVSRLRAWNRDLPDKRVRVGRRSVPFCRFYFGAGVADMPAIRIAAQIVDNAESHRGILPKIPTYN